MESCVPVGGCLWLCCAGYGACWKVQADIADKLAAPAHAQAQVVAEGVLSSACPRFVQVGCVWPAVKGAVAPDCPGCGSRRSMQTSTGWLRSGACVEADLCSRWASALKVVIGASPCQSAVKGATSGGPVYGGFVSGGLLRRMRVLARLLGLGPAVVN